MKILNVYHTYKTENCHDFIFHVSRGWLHKKEGYYTATLFLFGGAIHIGVKDVDGKYVFDLGFFDGKEAFFKKAVMSIYLNYILPKEYNAPGPSPVPLAVEVKDGV